MFNIKKGLIVSCQALEGEPLHSPYIMSMMAKAAYEGGAVGIRANGIDDINEIKKVVNLPIIGIIKKEYEDSNVFITPTFKEVSELVKTNVDIIALDATQRIRPNGEKLEELIKEIRINYPNQMIMADCATLDDVKNAINLEFDFISSTLVGYTEESKNDLIENNDFEILKQMIKLCTENDIKFIAEGNIDNPEKVKLAIELGAYSVVVGSMITRPQLITRKFTSNMFDKLYIYDFDDKQILKNIKSFESNIIFYTKKDFMVVKEFIEENKINSNIIISDGGKNIYYKNGFIIQNNINSYKEAIEYLIKSKHILKENIITNLIDN